MHSAVTTVYIILPIVCNDPTDPHLGLPDRGYFGHVSKITSTPLRAIWLCTLVSILPGLLDLASPIAANAIFSLCAIALDSSYIIPIFLRRVYHDHPEVMFKPGPFTLGNGFLGKAFNWTCIFWTLFVCVIFSFPTVLPITKQNMNYASVRILLSDSLYPDELTSQR